MTTLVGEWLLSSRERQTIRFDQHAIGIDLRLGKIADEHENGAKNQPHQQGPSVCAFVMDVHDITIAESYQPPTECAN